MNWKTLFFSRLSLPMLLFTRSLSLNGKAPIIERASYQATKISMIIEIPQGDNTLQAWFSNEDGNAVCGAYYLRVTRIF